MNTRNVANMVDNDSPKIMGVLNVTPDSFSDGGENYADVKKSLYTIESMISDGADIIDIGGESTRPGAKEVDIGEEINRVMPVLKKAISRFPDTQFSVDTRKYEVAKLAMEVGAHIINDVSGLQWEPKLADLCATHNATLIIMHSQGTPEKMQKNPQYNNVTEEIRDFLHKQAEYATSRGVQKIILDPGFGFGKTVEHNLKLITELPTFTELGYPVMVGVSRKSTIGHILGGRQVDQRLTGTICLHYHALLNGADILRVHDIREAKDSILVYNALKE